jgi:hypothetical protein
LFKAVPVTGRGVAWVCETSRLPHFLDNRLTDVGEDVSLLPPGTKNGEMKEQRKLVREEIRREKRRKQRST